MAEINESAPDRLIRRPDARKQYLGNMSPATEWRRLRTDPQFPKLSADGRHYRLSELQAYIRIVGAPRSAAAAAG